MNDDISNIFSISPIDGRYQSKTRELSPFFSEFGLIKFRVLVEIEYFIALCKLPIKNLHSITSNDKKTIKSIYSNFSTDDAIKIKKLEKNINHDVKAVEYFIKEKFIENGLGDYSEYIHFGLTSQDINNTAVPLMIKNSISEILLPQLGTLVSHMNELQIRTMSQ